MYDLLKPNKSRLNVREDPETKSFFLPDLTIANIQKEEEGFELINAGISGRVMASQKLNASSSRSHFILTVYLRSDVIFGWLETHKRRKRINLTEAREASSPNLHSLIWQEMRELVKAHRRVQGFRRQDT